MVTLSSTESEYIALCSGVQGCIGLKMVLQDIGIIMDKILVMEDNQGAQHLAQSKAVTQRLRHIEIKNHWLQDQVASGGVHVQYLPTNEMVADHFTKNLGETSSSIFEANLVFVEWECWS